MGFTAFYTSVKCGQLYRSLHYYPLPQSLHPWGGGVLNPTKGIDPRFRFRKTPAYSDEKREDRVQLRIFGPEWPKIGLKGAILKSSGQICEIFVLKSAVKVKHKLAKSNLNPY